MIALVVVPVLFIGLPWLIFHYVTRWKSQATITREDEQLLDELHEMARRLDDRMCSIERILSAENPNWRAVGCDPLASALDQPRSRGGIPAADPSDTRSVSNHAGRLGE
jgi:phage shock protein B